MQIRWITFTCCKMNIFHSGFDNKTINVVEKCVINLSIQNNVSILILTNCYFCFNFRNLTIHHNKIIHSETPCLT